MSVNPVGWFEIYVQDIARAKAFYETVLATKVEKIDAGNENMLAFPMDPKAAGAAGALVKMDGVKSGAGGTLVYFKCDDCAVEAGRVEQAGGRIHKAKQAIGEFGFIALALDSEGNMFGLHSMK